MKWVEAFDCVKSDSARICQLLAIGWFAVSTSRNPDLQATLMDRPPTPGVMCNILDAFGVVLPAEYVEVIRGVAATDSDNPSIH